MDFIVGELSIPQQYIRPTLINDLFVGVLSKRWISDLVSHSKLPTTFDTHPNYSGEEIQAFLWDSSSSLGSEWIFVYMNVIKKTQGQVLTPSSTSEIGLDFKDLSYSQFLHYVSQTNYKNLWKEAQKKYSESYKLLASKSTSCNRTSDADDVTKLLLKRIFNVPIIDIEANSSLSQSSTNKDHIVRSKFILESATHFVAIVEHIPCSVHQCLSLSPALLNINSVKPLFILYQFLHAVKEMHNRSLFIEGITWHHVFVKETLQISVLPILEPDLISLESDQASKDGNNLQNLTISWVRGGLSNYDYLMALNLLTGRQMNNPFNHPVLPWVSDLSSPFGNWRDLTKSKFRLNKGDRQLDLTFESSETKEDVSASSYQVPHHITDVLSEITYYVYQARRTPRSILCRYVRPLWNPLEYPSSIERLQQWTPDECIPQFFTDPSIFKSIHEDLPDLGYPSWATSPEDFIRKHRKALESPYVSERLHHWIDLTFGFRLSGSAAVKCKNVHLSLVDQHTHLTGRGIVQLFSHPHPRRLLPTPYTARSPPRLPPVSRTANETHLQLPVDYNPTGLLSQLETLNQMHGRHQGTKITIGGATNHVAMKRQRDVQWLATLMIELFSPLKFRLLWMNSSLEERIQVAYHIFQYESSEIPRCLKAFLKAVFENQSITAQGLPPPSAHQLLQPMVSLIPFPQEFPTIFTLTNYLRSLLEESSMDFTTPAKMLYNLNSSSCIWLVVPLIKALLRQSSTAINAALYLFDPIAIALGSQETGKEFLQVLVNLMTPEQPTAALTLLYHKRFLLLLQIRLGLRCFLNNFSVLLVEAVGGCYDFDPATCSLAAELGSATSATNLEQLRLSREKFHSSSCIEAELEGEQDAEVFSFEVGEETSLEHSSEEVNVIPGTPSRNSSRLSLAASAYPVRDIHVLDGCNVSQVSVDSILWHAYRLGPVLTARYLSRNLLRMLALCYVEETSFNSMDADQCKEFNMFQMSGSSLQGDFNAFRLLHCLSSIAGFYGEQFILLQYLPHAVEIVGRCNLVSTVSMLLEGGLIGCCSLILVSMPYLQDSSFMQCLQETLLRQLLLPMVDVVTSVQHLFARNGAGRSALAAKLVDCICAASIRLGIDAAPQFVSDLCLKLLKGFELVGSSNTNAKHPITRANSDGSRPDYMTHQRRLSSTLRQSQTKEMSQPMSNSAPQAATEAQARNEMASCFTDQFAFQLLSALNVVLGVAKVQQLLTTGGNAAQRFAARWAALLNKGSHETDGERKTTTVFPLARIPRNSLSDSENVAGSSGSRVSVVGNRIQLFEDDEDVADSPSSHETRLTIEEAQDMLCYRKADTSRHLRGNWLAYWEHESGRHDRDVCFNFKQIRLQQLTGHTAGIRAIYVMDSESGLLTAGRDKTARVWSLQSQGDGSSSNSARYIYPYHRKPLLGVTFVDSSRLAASCDGAVHLWDPFVGTTVRQLDASSSNRYPTVTAIKSLPSPNACLLVATAEGTLRLLDTRSPLTYQHELKISSASAGLVRCLTAGPNGNWVAAGHSSGILSLLDLRTGMVVSSWKGHEGEVLQVNSWSTSVGSQYMVSSSLDQSISVWSAEDGKFKFNLRGLSEPVHCLSINGGELITATTANRIGVYTSLQPNANFSSTKLRSDAFKGVLTSMALVPLNRTMLLGSDTGTVTLLC